jgi:hypothetical protein
LKLEGLKWKEILEHFPDSTENGLRKAFYNNMKSEAPVKEKKAAKILLLDIETLPMEAYVWGMWNQNPSLDMITQHTTILSWAAKWMGAPEDTVMYQDQRNAKDIRDDKKILQPLRDILEEADIVITQNGVKFDLPKLNYRFAVNDIKPYTKPKDIDTLKIAKSVFGFDSNKLQHLTDLFCVKYKKLDHKKYPGFSMWKACIDGKMDAFEELEMYNKYDILSLEELYVDHLLPWDDTINFAAWSEDYTFRCNCGHDQFKEVKPFYTKKSKFRRFACKKCGKIHRSSKNEFSKEKRDSLKV